MRVKITFATKIKKKQQKTTEYLCFRPTYCLMAKIFSTKVALDTLDFMCKNYT